MGRVEIQPRVAQTDCCDECDRTRLILAKLIRALQAERNLTIDYFEAFRADLEGRSETKEIYKPTPAAAKEQGK